MVFKTGYNTQRQYNYSQKPNINETHANFLTICGTGSLVALNTNEENRICKLRRGRAPSPHLNPSKVAPVC
jgi:hypothetical protein